MLFSYQKLILTLASQMMKEVPGYILFRADHLANIYYRNSFPSNIYYRNSLPLKILGIHSSILR